MKELEIIISTIIMSCSLFAVGDILLNKSEKVNLKNFSITVGISLIIILVNLISESILDNVLKIIIIFISYIGYYKLVFKHDHSFRLRSLPPDPVQLLW